MNTKLHLKRIIAARVNDTLALRDAFRAAITVVYPRLPLGGNRPAILQDGTIVVIDQMGDLPIDRVNPSNVLLEILRKFRSRRLWNPLLCGYETACGTIVVYRRIKRNRASQPASKSHLENMGIHAAN